MRQLQLGQKQGVACVLLAVSVMALFYLGLFGLVCIFLLNQSVSYILHSKQPHAEVIVPFTLHEDHIIVRASLAGTTQDCIVDTGTRDILWEGLNLSSFDAGRQITTYDQIPARWGQLPTLQIGDYELANVLTACLDTQPNALAYVEQKPIHVILGNYAFKDIVLTIDFKRQVLILRRPDFDLSQGRHPGDCLIDFRAAGEEYNGSPEGIGIPGTIAGHAVEFIVDTGDSSGGLIIQKSVRSQMLQVPPGRASNSLFQMQKRPILEETQPVAWSAAGIKGNLPLVVMDLPHPICPASLGMKVLKSYRITIDYPHRKILFEPN